MTKGIDFLHRPYFDDVGAFDLDGSRDQLLGFLPLRDHDDHHQNGDNHGHHDDEGNEHVFPLPYDAAAFPDGVSSGDVTQTLAVLWTRAGHNGPVTFQVATDLGFHHTIDVLTVSVGNTLVPAKVKVDNLHPDQRYYYRAVDASGHVAEGTRQQRSATTTASASELAVTRAASLRLIRRSKTLRRRASTYSSSSATQSTPISHPPPAVQPKRYRISR